MFLRNVIYIYQWVILLTSLICSVNGQEADCNAEPPSCDVPTRLPGFIPSDCSHPCSFVSPEGGCQLDALCFFKSVVGLILPAGYEHLLNLSSVETLEHAEWRVDDLSFAIVEEQQELDELVDLVAAAYLQYYKDNFPGTNRVVFPDEIKNSTCSGFCKSFDYDEMCKVNATCYYQNKLEQNTTVKNSHLLDLSSIYNDFDEYSLVTIVLERIKVEKIKLDTLMTYIINTFNVMVDIAVSNRNFGFILRHGCFFPIPGLHVGEFHSICPKPCMEKDSNRDCRLNVTCFMNDKRA